MNPNDAIHRLFELKEVLRDVYYVDDKLLEAIEAGIDALLKTRTLE